MGAFAKLKYFLLISAAFAVGGILLLIDASPWGPEHEQFKNAHRDECTYSDLTKRESCKYKRYRGEEESGTYSKYYYISKSGECGNHSLFEYNGPTYDVRSCKEKLVETPTYGYQQWESCWINDCNQDITFIDPKESERNAVLYNVLGWLFLVGPTLFALIGAVCYSAFWHRENEPESAGKIHLFLLGLRDMFMCIGGLFWFGLLYAGAFLIGIAPVALFISGWVVFFALADPKLRYAANYETASVDQCQYTSSTFVKCTGANHCDGRKLKLLYNSVHCDDALIYLDDRCYCYYAEEPPSDHTQIRTCWVKGCDEYENRYTFDDPEEIRSEGLLIMGLCIAAIVLPVLCMCYLLKTKKKKIHVWPKPKPKVGGDEETATNVDTNANTASNRDQVELALDDKLQVAPNTEGAQAIAAIDSENDTADPPPNYETL